PAGGAPAPHGRELDGRHAGATAERHGRSPRPYLGLRASLRAEAPLAPGLGPAGVGLPRVWRARRRRRGSAFGGDARGVPATVEAGAGADGARAVGLTAGESLSRRE